MATSKQQPEKKQTPPASNSTPLDGMADKVNATDKAADKAMETEEEMKVRLKAEILAEQEAEAKAKAEAADKARNELKERLAANGLKVFTLYKVKPVKGSVIDVANGNKRIEILQGYERTGESLGETKMEQRHADILNAQTPNSFQYYYQDGEDSMIKADRFF